MSHLRKTQKQLLTIQYLRAFLALGVLGHHAWGSTMSKTLPFFSFNWHGELMVEIFFLLSGFIMSYVVQTETNPTIFFKKRIARIYPTYWQCYFISMFTWIIFRVLFGAHVGTHGSWFVNLSLLPFEYSGSGKMVLTTGWSLFYEMFFYIIVTASLYFFKNPKNGIYLFFFISALFPKFFVFTNFDVGLFFDFIAGFLLMEMVKKFDLRDLALFIICLIFKSSYSLEASQWLLAACFILVIGLKLEEKGMMFKSESLLLLGNASYSIYLLHMPLLSVLKFFNEVVQGVLVDFDYTRIIVSSLIIGCGMAGIVYASVWNYENFEKKVALRLKKYIKI